MNDNLSNILSSGIETIIFNYFHRLYRRYPVNERGINNSLLKFNSYSAGECSETSERKSFHKINIGHKQMGSSHWLS